MAEQGIRYTPEGVPLGKEEGDPQEHLAGGDPDFEARFQARLIEIGRRFGLYHRGDRRAATGAPQHGGAGGRGRPPRRGRRTD